MTFLRAFEDAPGFFSEESGGECTEPFPELEKRFRTPRDSGRFEIRGRS